MAGFYLNGWLYTHVSMFVLFFISAWIAAAGGIVMHRWVRFSEKNA